MNGINKDYPSHPIWMENAPDNIEEALKHLREARRLLKHARCPKTLEKVRGAISSAKGARRNALNRKADLPHPRWEGRSDVH